MKCGVCHRALRSPESVRIGYGPVCYGRLKPADQKIKRKKATRKPMPPVDDDIIPGQMELRDFMPY
jgi:hypothetical protein